MQQYHCNFRHALAINCQYLVSMFPSLRVVASTCARYLAHACAPRSCLATLTAFPSPFSLAPYLPHGATAGACGKSKAQSKCAGCIGCVVIDNLSLISESQKTRNDECLKFLGCLIPCRGHRLCCFFDASSHLHQ